MAEPFLAEIRIMSFVFAPKGWALCNGQLLPINQNQALFSLLGTTFGGDGRVNFALPDLRGRTPIHVGSGHTLGERAASRRTRCRSPSCRRTSHVAERHDGAGRRELEQRRANADARRSRTSQRCTAPPATCSAMAPNAVANVGGSPGAPEHAAVPDAELLHRPAGHLPVAELRRLGHGTTLCRRDPDVRGELRARGLDVLRGPAAADLRERDAVPADRHDLRRRRREHVRAARPARPDPDPPGQRLHPRRDRRRGGDHADRQQIPAHTHPLLGVGGHGDHERAGEQRARAEHRAIDLALRRRTSRRRTLHPSAISPVGGSQPHTNFQPYLCVDFIISLFGIFPSPT